MALWCGIGADDGKSIFGRGFITTDWLVRTPRNERRNNLGSAEKIGKRRYSEKKPAFMRFSALAIPQIRGVILEKCAFWGIPQCLELPEGENCINYIPVYLAQKPFQYPSSPIFQQYPSKMDFFSRPYIRK